MSISCHLSMSLYLSSQSACLCSFPKVAIKGEDLQKNFLKSNLVNLFIFGCAESSWLCGLFSSCSKWRPLCCSGQASPCSGFSCCRAQALAQVGFSSCSLWAQELQPQALEPRLKCCGAWDSCSPVWGIFQDQGLNLCLLLWHTDSLPWSLQRSPQKRTDRD